MSLIEYLSRKALYAGLELRSTLGTDYILVLPIYPYSGMKNALFKGTLYQCNLVVNILLHKERNKQ